MRKIPFTAIELTSQQRVRRLRGLPLSDGGDRYKLLIALHSTVVSTLYISVYVCGINNTTTKLGNVMVGQEIEFRSSEILGLGYTTYYVRTYLVHALLWLLFLVLITDRGCDLPRSGCLARCNSPVTGLRGLLQFSWQSVVWPRHIFCLLQLFARAASIIMWLTRPFTFGRFLVLVRVLLSQ